jgi:hypothetical protein
MKRFLVGADRGQSTLLRLPKVATEMALEWAAESG